MVHFVYALLLLVLHDDNTWIIHELHPPNNIIGARLYERHYTIQSLTVLMRIILTNLNLIDTQTQLPEISIIRNIS
jgi:hypothetical protein